jgi:hypothetical protein
VKFVFLALIDKLKCNDRYETVTHESLQEVKKKSSSSNHYTGNYMCSLIVVKLNIEISMKLCNGSINKEDPG